MCRALAAGAGLGSIPKWLRLLTVVGILADGHHREWRADGIQDPHYQRTRACARLFRKKHSERFVTPVVTPECAFQAQSIKKEAKPRAHYVPTTVCVLVFVWL